MELAAACVTRSIELPDTADGVWESLATVEGLRGWLGDTVDVDLVPGGAGLVVDGATRRRVVVTEVDAGRSLGFVWWDEAAPEAASTVRISLEPADPADEAAGTNVVVTERIVGAARATVGAATVHDLAVEAAAGWDARLRALVGAPAHSAACV